MKNMQKKRQGKKERKQKTVLTMEMIWGRERNLIFE